LNNLSSSTRFLIMLGVGLTLATSAVVLARKRSHRAIPKPGEGS
jgi:hypothetical protein